jgi:hypothetical protein
MDQNLEEVDTAFHIALYWLVQTDPLIERFFPLSLPFLVEIFTSIYLYNQLTCAFVSQAFSIINTFIFFCKRGPTF